MSSVHLTEFTKIINNSVNSLQNTLDAAQPPEQAYSRSNFRSMHHIQTLRELMSQTKEYKIPIALAFVDFEKAFVSINPKTIIEALKRQVIDSQYIETLRNIYRLAKVKVKIYDT